MKRIKYISALIVSFLLTSTIFLKSCEDTTQLFTISCDFLAMIGGGIFCSTLVSWFVEALNKRKETRDKEVQRKFILASARTGFIRLLERELLEISSYYAKHIANYSAQWVREDISLLEMSKKIVWLLAEIEKTEAVERERNNHIITTDSIKKDDEKKKRLATNNNLYYKSLQQTLLELSTYYNTYYIAGVITEQHIELLRELTWEINGVLLYELDYGVDDGTVLVNKRLLFEKTSEYFTVLDILEDDTGHAHYKNVFCE